MVSAMWFQGCSAPFLQCFNQNGFCSCYYIDQDPYEVNFELGNVPVDGCDVGADFKHCCATADYLASGSAGADAPYTAVCSCWNFELECPGNTPMDTTSCRGTPVTGSAPGSTGSGTCDYTKYKDYCDLGCGDLSCVQFCPSCDALCEVSCVDDADCAAIGAGVCKHSESTGQGVCTKQPTVCL